eukprot:3786221-Rhodomonas_salina.1
MQAYGHRGAQRGRGPCRAPAAPQASSPRSPSPPAPPSLSPSALLLTLLLLTHSPTTHSLLPLTHSHFRTHCSCSSYSSLTRSSSSSS